MSKSQVEQHNSFFWEDDDNSCFAVCSCGRIGPAFADQPVADDEPPYALNCAAIDHYNHMHRVRQGLE